MSMSTNLIGVIPPDEKYRRMKQIWDMCRNENVSIPKEVIEFFGGESPGDFGKEIDLRDIAEEYNKEDIIQGLKIEISKIPKNIRYLIFYNSW